MAGVIVVIVVLTYVSAPTQRRSETAMGPQLKDWRVVSVSILDHSLNLILWSAKLPADAISCCVLCVACVSLADHRFCLVPVV